MKKRTKLQAAILAALASSSYANESCLTDVEDKGLLEVFQCIEAKLNTQQNRIAELEKENLRLQQKTDAISVSSDGKVGICTTPSQLIDVLGDARIGKTNARHYLEIASQSWPEIRWTTPTYTADMRIGMGHADYPGYGVSNGDWYVYSPGTNRHDIIMHRKGGSV